MATNKERLLQDLGVFGGFRMVDFEALIISCKLSMADPTWRTKSIYCKILYLKISNLVFLLIVQLVESAAHRKTELHHTLKN